jgi:hypothetical protein
MMDMMTRTFLVDSRNTFQDFKVGKPGTAGEKPICSSEKMHKYLHEGTKIKNMETYQTLACSLS